MKFTLSWLKDHLETDATLEDIVAKLTAIGLEVEEVGDPSEKFARSCCLCRKRHTTGATVCRPDGQYRRDAAGHVRPPMPKPV